MVVLHVGTTKVLQTLSGHQSWVSNVCWRHDESLRGAKDDSGHLELASADASGKIITWDVQAGIARNFFSDLSRTVLGGTGRISVLIYEAYISLLLRIAMVQL